MDFEAWADRAAPLINGNKLNEAIDSATKAVECGTTADSRAYGLGTRAAAYHFANRSTEAVADLTSAWKMHSRTIIDSIHADNLYEDICLADPSPEAILLLAEMRWTKAAQHLANNEADDANKWSELACQTLECLSVENDQFVRGSLSDELIDKVLIRTSALFREKNVLQSTIVKRMQSWIRNRRNKELKPLNLELSVK